MDGLLTMYLYPIYVGDVSPHYTIRRAFKRNFAPFYEFDWVNISKKHSLPKTQEIFLEILKRDRPAYTFMQLQNPINMSVATIKEMAKYTKILNWTGDVKDNPDWYKWLEEIGKEIYLTLFCNETDVEIMTRRGVVADYLQVGVDTMWYNMKEPKTAYPEIVFACNDYGSYPLSGYRVEVAKALKKEFGERFGLYGHGWDKHGIQTHRINNEQEADAYNSCKIAISVSNLRFKRYYSDRLLRIMACGGFALSHDFDNMEKDFIEGTHLAVFRNIDELISKCYYYLDHEEERKQIAANAYYKAQTECTWDYRCKELIQLLNKHNGSRIV